MYCIILILIIIVCVCSGMIWSKWWVSISMTTKRRRKKTSSPETRTSSASAVLLQVVICLPVCLPVYLSVGLPFCLLVSLSTCLFASVILSTYQHSVIPLTSKCVFYVCPVLQDLVLVPVHTKPQDSDKELDELYDVFLHMKTKWKTDVNIYHQ